MADEGFSHPSRMGLVDRIAAHVPYVTSTAWACLWLGDINTLEGIAIDLERNTSFFVTETLRWQFTTVSTKQEDKNLILPLTWQQKGLFKSPPVRRRLDRSLLISSSESKRSSRSDEAKEAAWIRDEGQCLLSKQELADGCHIYPISMSNLTPRTRKDELPEYRFWNSIRIFWSEDKVSKWEKSLFTGDDGSYQDSCRNILTLTPTARGYYNRAWFALKPVNEEQDGENKMTVEFYWLDRKKYESRMDLRTVPQLSPPGRVVGPGNARIWNHRNGTPLSSGDKICLETSDPLSSPLPSREILEMQWNLQRLSALSGAAEIANNEVDHSSGNDSSAGNDSHLAEDEDDYSASGDLETQEEDEDEENELQHESKQYHDDAVADWLRDTPG